MIDGDGRLIGLIPVRVLVNDIFLKIVPEEFLGEILDMEAALKYAAHVGARTAATSCSTPVVGAPRRDACATRSSGCTTPAERPADRRRRRGASSGYVDQLELLLVWVRATGRSALPRAARTTDSDR